MNEAFSIVGLVILLLEVVVGTGQFVVRLHSYDNPSGTDFNGTCCDSDVLKCQLDKCDLKFDICIGRNRGGSDCTYGTKQVIAEPDFNNIDFNENQKLSFPITNSLKDALFIKVNVTDQDTGGASVLVDTFHFVFNMAAYYNSTVIEYMDYLITGERPQLRSKLNLSVTSYCDQNYYGPDCDINCVAEDFGCNGHYKCGVRGEKICNPGWTGKDCDVQIPGGEGDCGFYKDSTELLPSLWEGFYTCPRGSSQIIQMNVTQRNKDEILTSAVLTFDGISVTASGSYGYRTLLIQGRPNQKNITDVKLHGVQPPSNLSSMAGEIIFNGDKKCGVVLNLQKSYLNQCGSGTCVRYGQKKNESYCCCAGKASTSCDSTTTINQTKSTTSSTATPSTTPLTTKQPATQRQTTQNPTTTPKLTTEEITTKTTLQPKTTPRPTTPETTTETSTKQPKTTTESTTTPQPTTPETTTETTSTTTTLVSTTETTTKKSTTVTTKPTTQSTTTTTTTTAAPSPSTTKPTTHKVPASTSVVQVFEDSFFINLLGSEIDSTLIDAIKDAYMEANKGLELHRSNMDFPYRISTPKFIYEERKHRGELLTFLRYNISISGVSSNIKPPSKKDIQAQIEKHYTSNVKLYDVVPEFIFPLSDSLFLDVYGPGPSDMEMAIWEKVILEVYKTQNNCNSSATACQLYDISIKSTDEYMDYNGSEVTRLYIFVLYMGKSIQPPNNKDPYMVALQNHYEIKAKFYTGSLDDHELLWYRHHYDLFIEGSVVQSDLTKFGKEIQNAWYKAEPGYNCSICNVFIHRREKYVGENGEPLTALVYYFQIREIFSYPNLDGNKNYLQYMRMENLTDINGNQYKLYNGSRQYRYSYGYNLLIEGEVDPGDGDQFTALTKQAWLDYNVSLASIAPSHLIEEYVSTSGDIVSNVVCFVSLGDLVINAHLISTPSMSWLQSWRKNQSQLVFSRSGGQPYQVYTKHSLQQLYLKTDLFSIYFEGYIKLDRWKDITESLQSAWNSTTFSGKRLHVQILGYSTFSVYLKREAVTMLWYALFVDEKLVSPVSVLYSQRTLVYNITMISLASKYPVYVLTEGLLNTRNQFTLYFTTKINYLDLEGSMKVQLLDIIRRKWIESSKYKNLDLYIDYQEKVFRTNSSILWKLVFYLMSNQGELRSQFVTPVTHQLFQSEEIKGITGQAYHLYTGQMSSTWLSYNSHFSLTFSSEVSEQEWFRVRRVLKPEWCKSVLKCSPGQDVTILIKEQEQYWSDITRKWCWRLVYFVQHGTRLISSQYHSSIDVYKLDFSWTNVYNETYKLVDNSVVGQWRFSRSFHLWTEEHLTVNTEAIRNLESALLQAWYKMNVRSDLKTCNCISVHVLPQKSYYAGSGKSIWRLTYFILYKNKVVMDAHLWPTLNTTLIDWTSVTSNRVKVRTDIDLYYYQYLLKFYLNHKLSISEYGKVEKALTKEYIDRHPDCGCQISIAHQEEVIDSHGKSSWVVYYHIVKNGKYQKPSSYLPINWNNFNNKYHFTSSDGHKLDFTWSWSRNHKYISYSQSGGLILQTWVPPSLYGRFGAWLQWYYAKYFKGSTVSVEMTNTTREYKKKDGSSAWHLPFILKVNGSIIAPPAINSTTFNTTFNATTSWKQKFSLVHTDEVTDKNKVFSVHLNHKVSESAKEDIKKAIIATFVQQHPGVNSSLVNLTFGNQQETFSNSKNKTTEKSSSWELSYTINVGGSEVDSRSTTSLNTSLLTSNLNVTGPNKVKYRVVKNTESTEFITARRVSSLYVSSFVSVEDIKKMEEKIALEWKKQYNSSEEVKVSFIRQKQYIDTNGRVVSKWDYTLTLNSSHLVRAEIPRLDFTHLQIAVGSLTSVTGRKYQLVRSTTNFLDYQMHFPLYLTTKMAREKKQDFKISLQKAWTKRGFGAVSVQIVKQEELIHKSTGTSTWKLVYFLKHNASNTVIDSRVTDNINASHLSPVVGPRGVYRCHTDLDTTMYLSRGMSTSVALNTKLDIRGRAKLQHTIAELLQKNLTASDLKSSISVDIAGQEEYFTRQNERAWRILYFIRVGDQYVPASSLVQIDHDRLAVLLANFTTLHTQKLRILKESDLLHSYRNAFSVYFTSKVARTHYLSIQESILTTWKKSCNCLSIICNCLDIDGITDQHQEEVVDSKGVSFWKLSYFMRRNGTLIESLTHKPLDIKELSEVLINVTNIKGQPYTVKAIKETVTRSRMLFSFHMTTEIGYGHKEKFQTSLKAAWIRLQPEMFKDKEMSVKILRNSRYVDIAKSTAVWQVDYTIERTNITVDPMEVPTLSAAELQKNLTFTTPKGTLYQVIDRSASLVDYRIHFALFVSAEVKSTDFSNFGTALEQYWTSRGFTNATVTISLQERFIQKPYGKMLWKLVVFAKNGTAYIDSRTSEDVNTTQLQTSITSTDAQYRKYRLMDVRSNTLRRYNSGFSVILSHTVLRSDLSHVTEVLRKTWAKTDMTLKNVSVEVLSQENYVNSKMGLVSKILYFLSVDRTEVDSGMVGNVNLTALRQQLMSLSASRNYQLVLEGDFYQYNWLFTLDLTVPLLTKDYRKMEYQLAAAWRSDYSTNFKNVTVKILSQESLVTELGSSVSRVLYSLNGDSKPQKATQHNPVSPLAMLTQVTLVKSGTSYRYISRIYSGSNAVFRYSDLHRLELNGRVRNYTLLENQLKEAWNSTVNVDGEKIEKVTIINQEKILLSSGELAFRLLYHVQSRNVDYSINRQLVTGPSHNTLIKRIKVVDPAGVSRKVLNITKGYRMSQVFSVVLNRQVFISDHSKFEKSLLHTLQTTWTDIDASSTLTFSVRSSERVVDKSSGKMLWRYTYVATANGVTVDVSHKLSVSHTALTSNLNFTSPTKQKYVVVNTDVGSYSEMFSLQVEGILNFEQKQTFFEELKKHWSNHTVPATLDMLLREEFLSELGEPVTKFSYFVKITGRNEPMYPSVTKPPPYASMATRLRLRLYMGKTSLRYSDCFRLYVTLPRWNLNRSTIETALTQTWQQQSQATKNVAIKLIDGMDSFVGSYGLQISAFLYTISYQSYGQTRVITPDITVYPDSQKVQTALSSQNSRLTVYHSVPYRTRSLFYTSVIHLQNTSITVRDVESLGIVINETLQNKETWRSNAVGEHLKSQIVSTKEYRTLDERSLVTRIYFYIHINNKTVDPWDGKLHLDKFKGIIMKLLQNNSAVKDHFSMNNQSENKVFTIFVQGHHKEFSDIRTALQKSWKRRITSGSVTVTTHSTHRYVSDNWNRVTKLTYTIKINGSSPESLKVSSPSFAEIEAELKKVNKAQCPCYAKKARKEYLLGSQTSIKVTKVHTALKSVWTSKNPGIDGQKFTVKIKSLTSRQKRETESATIKTKLVGNDNKEITPVQYTVALEGHEPDSSFVDTPSSHDLTQPLTQAGAAPCGCSPKLAGTLQLKGKTDQSEKQKISDAIKDAFAKENQDVMKNHIKTDAKLNNTKSDGDDVTVVDYTVQRTDDEPVENLKSPKRVDLERSLNTAGKTLYSRAPVPPPEEEEDKKLAIYIAVGVLAFIILVLVVCYVVYIRRRSKKGNLLKREQDVKEKNAFDTEHFSEPAASQAYQNPNYEPKQDLKNV
ncbi:uncharacterized protein LOC133190156 [Saccostrea echinata]|uniref:uncharacterized protein LOC133190156 n=1 Tax=Saccostrea echinata TaxID=191078 RepID=UPI002A827913|nr:uncharacterized protein LOC133190156 [Saccostrea echinata]